MACWECNYRVSYLRKKWPLGVLTGKLLKEILRCETGSQWSETRCSVDQEEEPETTKRASEFLL